MEFVTELLAALPSVHQAADDAVVTWPSALTSLCAASTVLLAAIGGFVGYTRFHRARTLHVSVDIELTVKVSLNPDGHKALLIFVAFTNAGSYLLSFPTNPPEHDSSFPPDTPLQLVSVAFADRAMWDDAAEYGEMLWTMGETISQEISKYEGSELPLGKLEPGQRLSRCLLVPLPDDCVACFVAASVRAFPLWLGRPRPSVPFGTERIVLSSM